MALHSTLFMEMGKHACWEENRKQREEEREDLIELSVS